MKRDTDTRILLAKICIWEGVELLDLAYREKYSDSLNFYFVDNIAIDIIFTSVVFFSLLGVLQAPDNPIRTRRPLLRGV